MPSSKNRKSSKKQKTTKKNLNFWTCTLNSPLLLILLFVVVLINVSCLWTNRDNETLFLFILIAFLVHAKNKNMIIVLGVPLVIINVLVFLRGKFRNKSEGFAQNVDEFNHYDFQEWVKKYVQSDDNLMDGSDYADMTEKMNIYGSLFDVVDPIMQDTTQMADNNDATNKETVENLQNYLTLVYNLNDKDDFYPLQDAKYVRKMIDTYLEEMNKDITGDTLDEIRESVGEVSESRQSLKDISTETTETADKVSSHSTIEEKIDTINTDIQALMTKLDTV